MFCLIERPDCAIITRPTHSKLGWMTPRACARSSASEGAAQRQGSVPRPLATRDTEGSNQPRLSLSVVRLGCGSSRSHRGSLPDVVATLIGARRDEVAFVENATRAGVKNQKAKQRCIMLDPQVKALLDQMAGLPRLE